MLPAGLLGATVTHGRVPTVAKPIWDGPLADPAQYLTANSTLAVLTVAGVGAFTVDAGRRVVILPAASVDEILVEAHLYGTVAALLLGQQGRLALHASSVEINGMAVAVSGRSGAGKSTTGLELARRGHRLVTDDISPLERDLEGGGLVIKPFGRPVHVWPDTLAALGTPPAVSRVLPGSGKLVLPSPHDGAAATLGAVVVLRTDLTVDRVVVAALAAPEAMRLIARQIVRGPVIDALWPEVVFEWMTAVASAVPVFVIRRPACEWTATATADAVETLTISAGAAVR